MSLLTLYLVLIGSVSEDCVQMRTFIYRNKCIGRFVYSS